MELNKKQIALRWAMIALLLCAILFASCKKHKQCGIGPTATPVFQNNQGCYYWNTAESPKEKVYVAGSYCDCD